MEFTHTVSTYRRKLERFCVELKIIRDQGKSATSENQQQYFKAMNTALETFANKFDDMWDALGDAYCVANQSDTFPTTEEKGLLGARRNYYYEAKSLMEGLVTAKPANLDRTTMLNDTRSSKSLPKLTLPKFDGNPLQWVNYRDNFLAAIHNEPNISVIDKFQYLKMSISGSASSVIQHLPIQEVNYQLAWKALLDTYDNKRLLATAYLNQIVSANSFQGKVTVEKLRGFLSSVVENISAFKLLDIPQESDYILFFLAINLLDSATREQFEEAHKEIMFPTFDLLKKFLLDKCTVLQLADSSKLSFSGASNFHKGNVKSSFESNCNSKSYSSKTCLLTNQSRSTPNQHRSTSSMAPCFVCKTGNHNLLGCQKFYGASVEQRFQFLVKWDGCRNCLLPNHSTKNCKSKWHCRLCKYRHHSLLHKHISESPPPVAPNLSNNSQPSSSCLLSTHISSDHKEVLLGTVTAEIKDIHGNFHQIRCLIDSGSQQSFLTLKYLHKLGLAPSKLPKRITLLGQTLYNGIKGRVNCEIRPSSNNTASIKFEAIVIKNITGFLPSNDLPESVWSLYTSFTLADRFWLSSPIDCLLGADVYGEIMTGTMTHISTDLPKMYSSIFGEVVIGQYPATSSSNAHPTFLINTLEDTLSLKEEISKFWEYEEPHPIMSLKNIDDVHCEEHFMKTHKRMSNGRYMVRLPFKASPPSMQNSYHLALKRLGNLESKLARDPALKTKYCEFMNEYRDLNHLSPTNDPSKFVIPHHCVQKLEPSGIKIRVVFDGSAKTKAGSLNEFLHVGPKLQKDISSVLLGFRIHSIVFTADAVKMYRQILIDPEDRPYQHILWKFEGDSEPQKLQLNTVTYGLTSAPFLALRVMQQLVIDEGAHYPQAAKVLERDLYVDDIATGASSLKDACDIKEQLINLLNSGGFTLSKWATNNPALLSTTSLSSVCNSPVSLQSRDDPAIKILGLQWDPSSDYFTYKIVTPELIYTKRSILSNVAKIFDPLGFLAPAVLIPKLLIQDIWKEELGWDDVIPPTLQLRWKEFVEQFMFLLQIKVPRFIGTSGNFTYQIIGFCDASTKAYSASCYCRIIKEDEIQVFLLTSKTKLAPLKTLTIPKLELNAALLLAKLYSSLSIFLDRLSSHPSFPSVFFTDSSTVLSWLRTPLYSLKIFVANRVASILELSPNAHWRHVCSAENPSDIGSRGILPNLLINNSFWWNGPTWLSHDENTWPVSLGGTHIETLPEIKGLLVEATTASELSPLIKYMSKFSNYKKMLKCVAVLNRLAYNFLNKPNKRTGPILPNEVETALEICIKSVQLHYFFGGNLSNQSEFLKPFHQLCPFFNDRGVLMVGGRLKNANLPSSAKHPILVPHKSHLASIMVDWYHEHYLHPGPNLLQALIQKQFWIPSLRRLIRHRSFLCLKCYKSRAQSIIPIMGDLPASRLESSHPFSHTGVDFAGPIIIRESLRRKAICTKVYICLYVCFSTKALHLEVVSDLTSDAFLASFTRFTSRRGLPQSVYSDCGSNFIGAANQLKDLQSWFRQSSTQDAIIRHSAIKGVKWNFNPPYAPHFGGLWEAGVKSVKGHLNKIIGKTPVTLEELTTYLSRIEAILNSRPLCALSSDPEENDYLSPGHFLIGRPLLSYPEPSLIDTPDNRLPRWQLLKKMNEEFWERWRTEYLSTLQRRNKWTKQSPDLKEGALVLLMDPGAPILSWPTARITDLHSGADGHVRVVTVKTATSTFKRPVCKVVPLLPLSEQAFQDTKL